MLLLLLSGCDSQPETFLVHGIVVYPDGKPLTEGTIEFETLDQKRPITASGEINDDGTIFAAAAGLVNSAALARIHAGSNWPVGLLALGARDDAFHPGQGTELISFLCRVLEASVARTLETDAV